MPPLDARVRFGRLAQLISRRDWHHEPDLFHCAAKLGEFRRSHVGVIWHHAHAPLPPWLRLDSVGIRHTPATAYQPDRGVQHGTAGKRENRVEPARRRHLDALNRTTPTPTDHRIPSAFL